jgi:hypothetical protein
MVRSRCGRVLLPRNRVASAQIAGESAHEASCPHEMGAGKPAIAGGLGKALGTTDAVEDAIGDREKAMARITRAISNAAEDADVAELVAERRQLREELRKLREDEAGNVESIEAARSRKARKS